MTKYTQGYSNKKNNFGSIKRIFKVASSKFYPFEKNKCKIGIGKNIEFKIMIKQYSYTYTLRYNLYITYTYIILVVSTNACKSPCIIGLSPSITSPVPFLANNFTTLTPYKHWSRSCPYNFAFSRNPYRFTEYVAFWVWLLLNIMHLIFTNIIGCISSSSFYVE